MHENLIFYSENAQMLVAQYDSVPFESVHKDWLEFIPLNGSVLDIGAGSGRDARYLESKGLKVFAVEPALDLMELAINKSKYLDIIWLQDSLPTLSNVKSLGIKFNLILLSAVWMHLSPEERHTSIQTLAPLLEIRGKLVVTLRHGEFSDGRTAFPVSADEVKELGDKHGLTIILKTEPTKDQLGRDEVTWQTLVLEK